MSKHEFQIIRLIGEFLLDNKKSYRIGRIGTRVFPDRGGPANHIFNISFYQNLQGCQNYLITSKPIGKPSRKIDRNSFSLPFQAPKEKDNFIYNTLFALSFIILTCMMSIYVFSRNRINLIHAHSPGLSGIVGLFVAKIIRKPIIYTIHGVAGIPHKWSKTKRSIFEYLLERIVIENADGLIIISRDYHRIIDHYHPKGLITCIGNGVDAEYFQPIRNMNQIAHIKKQINVPVDAIILAWVGNFDLEEKVRGIFDTIKALEILYDRTTSNWYFILVGEGRQRDRIEEYAANSRIKEKLSFLGHRSDINQILGISDIFILVSHHEGSPNAILEAMASGVACIGSNIGGIPDILKDTGILIDVGNIQQLYESISLLLSNIKMRSNYAKLARQRVETTLTWNRIASMTLDFYTKILTRNKASKWAH